ncbi:DUF5050 domain-containing protein [Pontimicrobium aquaticum]|uniref:DUF5050 domain-containing protein n=1 Tax=Pontimicrobium aquaticum TaxID=2565367 RepID=A0A4U0F0E7_9FLAO|nr:DUF5050 domain-containing protein [Pontimicrobium aquaticum]TJY37823.1 DUF5050 domain-containing protein [Pontimicrobium aquaticum]
MKKLIKATVLVIFLIQLVSCNSKTKTNSKVEVKDVVTQNDSLVYDTAPRWSPDGTKILFYTYRHDDKGAELYSLDISSEKMTRLTNTFHNEWWSDYSKDGKNIFFSSDKDKKKRFGGSEIYVMNVDGTNVRQVTKSRDTTYNIMPRVSPKGNQLLYSSDAFHYTNSEIYLINESLEEVNLSNNPAKDQFGSWSPDGEKVIFQSNRDGNFEIYVMNVDGTNIKRLTNNNYNDIDPSWSVNNEIAFISNRDGDNEIFIMNSDGSNQRQLTFNEVLDVLPSWSPDGSTIAFGTYRHGKKDKGDIYTIRRNGKGLKRMTPK